MIFRSRQEAGTQLAKQLYFWNGRSDAIVLALPRGGAETGFAMARDLDLPLDILLARKLGVPGHEELAFGAVAPGGFRYLDAGMIQATGIGTEQIEKVTEATLEVLRRQDRSYRANRAPLDVSGKTVILTDDGVATGASMQVAIQALRAMGPARVIVAVPVAPSDVCEHMRSEVDELFCSYQAKQVREVGQFYWEFPPVTDEEVVELLERAKEFYGKTQLPGAAISRRTSPAPSEGFQGGVILQAAMARLEGVLSLPADAAGLVLFAHGSSSSRYNPRNRYLAKALQARRLGTLLFDLLTVEEDSANLQMGGNRFDIRLLAERLSGAVEWLEQQKSFRALPMGYCCAGTGTAAALVTAANHPEKVQAIVSRGGRPDLAGEALGRVEAPTLLLVGEADGGLIGINEEALGDLGCAEKKLITVPGATHPFEDPGTLELVAHHAAEWFCRHLGVPAAAGTVGTAPRS